VSRLLVAGFGENSVDEIFRLPSWPEPGTAHSKLPIVERRIAPGGQVATTLATCAAFGRETRYLGSFGDDEHGRRIRTALTGRGVDISRALTRNAPNRYAAILIDATRGERVVLWQRHAALQIDASEIESAWLEEVALLHVDAVHPAAATALARLARASGIPVTCDIDQVTDDTRTLLDAVSHRIVAGHVPQALTGERDVERALSRLAEREGGSWCVTLGERGAVLCEAGAIHQVDGHRLDAVDTTGAGDVFRGAFIHALLEGRDPQRVLEFANAAAALSCAREGAMDGVPGLEDVQRLLASQS